MRRVLAVSVLGVLVFVSAVGLSGNLIAADPADPKIVVIKSLTCMHGQKN